MKAVSDGANCSAHGKTVAGFCVEVIYHQEQRFLTPCSPLQDAMDPDRTEIEWICRPSDLFEAPYRCATPDWELLFEDGRAVATLRLPQDPINGGLEDRIRDQIESVLLVRQLQVHRTYQIEGPRTYQHAEGRKHVAIRVGSAALTFTAGHADIVATDSTGKVVRDTRAERIGADESMLQLLAPRAGSSSLLRSLLQSYSSAVSDPANELVHLYEIRDALSKHFGGEEDARMALGISKTEWQRLGSLANVEPLDQGRHRGKHPDGRRSATEAELQEARQIVHRWIDAFARAREENAG